MHQFSSKSLVNTLLWLFLFSIAMGYLESSVVVYLRKIYYPNGFQFPLNPIDSTIAITEFFREAATIIMLLSVGILIGKNGLQRFAGFLFCFGVWDIFYYVFLKLLIDWPESFMTWDILFLIPVPWVGPVLAPCLLSLTMILFSLLILNAELKKKVMILKREWIALIFGCLIIISSFTWDYFRYISGKPANTIFNLREKQNLLDDMSHFIPTDFNWILFSSGEIIICLIIYFIFRRAKSLQPKGY